MGGNKGKIEQLGVCTLEVSKGKGVEVPHRGAEPRLGSRVPGTHLRKKGPKRVFGGLHKVQSNVYTK